MVEQQNQEIHSFERGPREKIQMTLKRYRDDYYLDIRLWFQTKEDPTFRPTKKGITFPIKYMTDFYQGMERVLDARERLGA